MNKKCEVCFVALKYLALIALFFSSNVVLADEISSTKRHRYVDVRIVTPFSEGHILAESAHKFKEMLEKRSQYYNVSVQTGFMNEQSVNPASQSCDPNDRVADVIFTGGQPIQDYAPEYFFFNGPYVIRDFDHLLSVWKSGIGQDMADKIWLEGNFVIFNPIYRGYRQFTSNKPIVQPKDLNGVLLRLPPVPDWISVWEALSVVPVAVPLTGIYDALESGLAEASEGDLTQISSLRLYDVQSHLSLTNHLASFGMPIANACFYQDQLNRKLRKKFDQAMRKVAKWATRRLQDSESQLLSELEASGMTVVAPDAAAIRRVAEPAINELFETKWTVTTWADVLAQ